MIHQCETLHSERKKKNKTKHIPSHVHTHPHPHIYHVHILSLKLAQNRMVSSKSKWMAFRRMKAVSISLHSCASKISLLLHHLGINKHRNCPQHNLLIWRQIKAATNGLLIWQAITAALLPSHVTWVTSMGAASLWPSIIWKVDGESGLSILHRDARNNATDWPS